MLFRERQQAGHGLGRKPTLASQKGCHGSGRETHQPWSGEVGAGHTGPREPVAALCVSVNTEVGPRLAHAMAAAPDWDTHTLRSLRSMPFIFSMALSAASCVSKWTKA